MTSTSDVPQSEEARLGVLMDTERALEERLAAHRRDAEARVRAAQAAADEYVLSQSRLCAAKEAEQLEQRRRQCDEQLAAAAQTKQEELARAMSALVDLRDQLCAQMLVELLLLR